jgi:hypothetical protein
VELHVEVVSESGVADVVFLWTGGGVMVVGVGSEELFVIRPGCHIHRCGLTFE